MNNLPEGLIVHCAGELEGRFQVFNIWESAEHSERFVEERLRPAQVAVMDEEAIAQLPPPEVVQTEIHNYFVNPAG